LFTSVKSHTEYRYSSTITSTRLPVHDYQYTITSTRLPVHDYQYTMILYTTGC